MKIKDLDKWLTPLTNLAVLAGVIFLVVELRQNQDSMELDRKIALLEAQQTDFNSLSEQRWKVISDPEVAQLHISGSAGEELSEADSFRFSQLCQDRLWAGALMFERARALGRPQHAEATAEWVQRMTNWPGNEACWLRSQSTFKDWGYVEFVEAVEANREAARTSQD